MAPEGEFRAGDQGRPPRGPFLCLSGAQLLAPSPPRPCSPCPTLILNEPGPLPLQASTCWSLCPESLHCDQELTLLPDSKGDPLTQ